MQMASLIQPSLSCISHARARYGPRIASARELYPACPKETVPNRRTTAAIRSQLLSFDAYVDELSKVLVKGGDRHVLRDRGGCDQAVDKVSLRSLITVQSIEMDCHLTDLDARTGDQASERGGNVGARMPVKRFEHKHTLCQNNREHHDSHVTSIAGIEQFARYPGVFVMILYEIADNQIRVDKSLLAHRVSP